MHGRPPSHHTAAAAALAVAAAVAPADDPVDALPAVVCAAPAAVGHAAAVASFAAAAPFCAACVAAVSRNFLRENEHWRRAMQEYPAAPPALLVNHVMCVEWMCADCPAKKSDQAQ